MKQRREPPGRGEKGWSFAKRMEDDAGRLTKAPRCILRRDQGLTRTRRSPRRRKALRGLDEAPGLHEITKAQIVGSDACNDRRHDVIERTPAVCDSRHCHAIASTSSTTTTTTAAP